MNSGKSRAYPREENPDSFSLLYPVNLMGSGTPTNRLLEVKFSIGDGELMQDSKIGGVLNQKSDIMDASNAWLWGKGEWNQITGTLKFTVLQRISKESPSLTVKVVLKNRDIAQDAVRPYLRICGKTSWPAVTSGVLNYVGFDTQGYTGQALLGSYVSKPEGCDTNAACALKKANSQGVVETVAAVSFAAVQEPSMVVGTPEALVSRGLSTQMYAALPAVSARVPCNVASASDTMPTCSTLAGKLGTLLTVAAASLANNAVLNLLLETSVVRRRGGCITTDTQSFDICLPGAALSLCPQNPKESGTLVGSIAQGGELAQDSSFQFHVMCLSISAMRFVSEKTKYRLCWALQVCCLRRLAH